MADIAYFETRRKGRRTTIVQVGTVTANPETGERVGGTTVTNVRLGLKEQTAYKRIIKAQACQQDVGMTTFIFWTRDIPAITKLTVEDYIIRDGVKYNVVNSVVEDTALVVTAEEQGGAIGKQEMQLLLGNSLSLDQTNNPVVT
jgi:hypothetical protein